MAEGHSSLFCSCEVLDTSAICGLEPPSSRTPGSGCAPMPRAGKKSRKKKRKKKLPVQVRIGKILFDLVLCFLAFTVIPVLTYRVIDPPTTALLWIRWAEAGYELFTGVNVPSKAFGEFVEIHEGTPSISAQELKAKMDAGEEMVVLDSRPMEEFRRMSIPTGIDVPGAELVYRLHDMVPSPETLIVVNCAGRTRSIIGAQSLINAGVPNQVVALRNGTMGWELAGLGCATGQDQRAPPVSPEGLAKAGKAVAGVARRFGVQTIGHVQLEGWRSESDRRTLYLLDVRGPDEYEAGHLPGSVSAPGGQLVQATDRYVGTQGARLVLVDDTGVRATMTASWLIQLGWSDVVVLTDGLAAGGLETGPYAPAVLGLDQGYLEGIGEIGPAELDGAAGGSAWPGRNGAQPATSRLRASRARICDA